MENTPNKKLREILTSDVIGVLPETSFAAAMEIMGEHKISCIPVLENRRAIGILTERSIVSYAALHKRDLDVCQSQELMSTPVLTARQDMEIDEAYELLMNKKIRHLVVVDDQEQAVGVVTFSNIIEHLGYDYFVEMKKTSQIMTKIPYTMSGEVTAQEAMGEMASRAISCLIIAEGKQPVGILTERDIIGLLNRRCNLREIQVQDVMSKPVHTIFGDAPVLGASRMMKQKKIRRLVVVDDNNELLGLITQYDIVKGVEVRYIENLKYDVKKKNLEVVDALRELGEKNVYLDNLLNSSVNMGIAASDLSGNIIHYNPAAEKMFGVPGASIIGRDVRELHRHFGLDLERFDKIMEKIQANKVHTFSWSRQDKNGLRYLTARVSGIRNQVHRLVGLMLICQDVTESRLAEEALKQSLAIQQTIIDGGAESIMVINRDYSVRMTNEVVQQLHLKSPEQNTQAMFCYEITHRRKKPCAGKNHRCPMLEVVKTKKPCTLTHIHTRKDGYKYPVEIIASPVFDAWGEVVGIVEVGRDITARLMLEEERKKNEERLFHQQKAESIATLAGGVAHDFNNILTIVLGNAELLKKTISSDKRQSQFVDSIIFSTQRMSQLIRQLLSYANQGDGQPHFSLDHEAEHDIISMNQLVQEALELVAKEEKASPDLEIALDLEPDLWPVKVDIGQTRRMLVNIILNAIESMGKDGGRLHIRSENIVKRKKWTCAHHDEQASGGYVRLSISDTGPGIPKNIHGRIFEPFFSTKFVGRGLGLAAALGIVRNQGGCLSVENAHPRGSIFRVLLPRAITN